MSTVTPNFNWPVPTSTDLVRDGATAIEALGDSIDASLVDLKGGTTGQVLSKTSNTDMDFVWVTSDDANAIQNTIVDAKGDLIAASAADTPARLAVGGNGDYLVADSTAATGLKWETGGYTSYTPTIVAQTGTPTTVTASGAYIQIGKTVFVTGSVTITNAGTAGGFMKASLPSTPNITTVGTSLNTNITGEAGTGQMQNGDANIYMSKYNNGTWWSSGAVIAFSGFYRVA